MRHSLCRIGKFIKEYFSKLTWVFGSFLSLVFLLIIDNFITFLLTFRHLRKYRFNFRDTPRSDRKLQFYIITTHFCEKKNSKNGPKFPINQKSSILVRSLRTLRPTGYFSRSNDFVVKKIIEIPSKNTLLLELFEIQTDFLKIVVHKNFRI